ncbi:unnamed protein product [Lasius platythorax]|uniref:Uncharacterized protein n=1 Tax=Lasius platythorax TaxID=488582 RepID=A0AAV2N5D0_9HYME
MRPISRDKKDGSQQILIPCLMLPVSPSSRERIVDNRHDIRFRSPSNWNATVLRRMLPPHQPQPSDPQKLIALPQQPRENPRRPALARNSHRDNTVITTFAIVKRRGFSASRDVEMDK